jgi:hypothetical protein
MYSAILWMLCNIIMAIGRKVFKLIHYPNNNLGKEFGKD